MPEKKSRLGWQIKVGLGQNSGAGEVNRAVWEMRAEYWKRVNYSDSRLRSGCSPRCGVWAVWQQLEDKNHTDTSCLSEVHLPLERLGSRKQRSPNQDIPPVLKDECPSSRPLASQCLLHPHAHPLVPFVDAGGHRTGHLSRVHLQFFFPVHK